MTSSAPSSLYARSRRSPASTTRAVGLFLLLAADRFAALFGVLPAQPPIFSDLNGLFPAGGRRSATTGRTAIRGRAMVSVGDGTGLEGRGRGGVPRRLRRPRHSPRRSCSSRPATATLAVLTLAALAGSRNTPARPAPMSATPASDEAGSRPERVRHHRHAGDDEDRRRPRIAERGERPRRIAASRRRSTNSALTATPANSTTAKPV